MLIARSGWSPSSLFHDRTCTEEITGVTEDAGGGDEGLGGDAGYVDAGAAHLVPLHHDDLVAGLGAQHRQGLAGLAASDDEKVDLLDRNVCLVGRVAVDGGL